MRRLRFRKRGLVILPVVAAAILLAQHYGLSPVTSNNLSSSQPGLYLVAYDIDGDTIAVKTPSGEESVRFIGVDTPETHKPNTPVQCYGPKAAAYTKSLVENQKVRLVADPLDTNRDRYNRLLRYVYLPDGTLLNLRLIKNGYGFYYPYFPFSKKAVFATAERQAISQNLGLWARCHPTATDEGGYTSNPIT